jgi:hypothetical protein
VRNSPAPRPRRTEQRRETWSIIPTRLDVPQASACQLLPHAVEVEAEFTGGQPLTSRRLAVVPGAGLRKDVLGLVAAYGNDTVVIGDDHTTRADGPPGSDVSRLKDRLHARRQQAPAPLCVMAGGDSQPAEALDGFRIRACRVEDHHAHRYHHSCA